MISVHLVSKPVQGIVVIHYLYLTIASRQHAYRQPNDDVFRFGVPNAQAITIFLNYMEEWTDTTFDPPYRL